MKNAHALKSSKVEDGHPVWIFWRVPDREAYFTARAIADGREIVRWIDDDTVAEAGWASDAHLEAEEVELLEDGTAYFRDAYGEVFVEGYWKREEEL